MSLLSWFMPEDKKDQTTSKFIPKINFNPKSTLHVEVQPKDPTNCSNIVLTAFASQQVRTIVPIRVEWSRFKIKEQAVHSVQKIHCLVGNTYMCEPGDVGAYIKAVVRSLDQQVRGEAEVTIGPISIDVMMKRMIEGAMYSKTLLSQVVLVEKDRKNNITVRLNTTDIEFVDENSGQKLVKDYSMSEPKIQLNPKDSTRVYLRYEQDQMDEVRQWLNLIFHVRNTSIDQSSMDIKVAYKSHSQSSSKMKLFQKSQRTHCINKMELRFISRNSRDLFLFTQRAFICKEDMKNSVYIQRIQTLQNLATEEEYYRFLGYMNLKHQIIRLADFAKELEDDRDAKVKDLVNMEESIAEMTLTYLKIIQQKGKNQHIDFEASYSQINNTREDMLSRKNMRQLKKDNQSLKQRLREMNEELQLLKFFKEQKNESMIFNQTSNPFAKKNQELSVSYQVQSPQKQQRKNMFQMSMNYTKLLEENNELKRNMMGNKKKGINVLDQSKNMMELLGDIEKKQDIEPRYQQYEARIGCLQQENEDLRRKVEQLVVSNQTIIKRINNTPHKSIPIKQFSVSYINQSGLSSNVDSSINQSITSQMQFAKLQQNLRYLSTEKQRLQQDNTRLRRQRDYYRNQASKLNGQIKQLQMGRQTPKLQSSNHMSMNDNSVMYRYRQENQSLQNEKKALIKKLQSLSKENASGIRQEFILKQRKLKQYQQLVDRLKLQNISLSKQLQEKNSKNQQSNFFINQNIKIKKINSQLLEQIKSLKIQLSLINDNLYNSRVIQIQNQLDVFKSGGNNMDGDSRKMLEQINELTKTNTKLKQENEDRQVKLNHQTITIQKLMRESTKMDSKSIKRQDSSNSSSTKERAHSQRPSQATVQELQKYKREVKKLQEQIIFTKKSSDAINRSRDLTLQMDGYYEQKMQVMKSQLQSVYHQNQNLSKMCERYGKDAREASKQANKWKQKAMQLMRQKTQQSILLSEN